MIIGKAVPDDLFKTCCSRLMMVVRRRFWKESWYGWHCTSPWSVEFMHSAKETTRDVARMDTQIGFGLGSTGPK